MKNFSRITFILLASTLCGFLAAVFIRGMPVPLPQNKPERTTVDWTSYDYQVAGAAAGRLFNIKLVMKKNSNEPAHVRLAFNQQDQANYYFVDFSPEKTRIARVQDGVEVCIGVEGRPARLDGSEEILIRRRELQIGVYFGRDPIVAAYDDTYQGGQILMGQIGNMVSLSSFRVQPTGELFFADDFMKAATQQGEWDVVSGNWRVETLKNPGLSSNAFYMIGAADSGSAMATTGHGFWDDYSFKISCRPMDDKPVGILACFRGPQDYYLFKWESAAEGARTSHLQLIRMLDGNETVLAEANGGFTTGQWYELQLSVEGSKLTARVDGNIVLHANDPLLCSGRIGVFTEGTTHFDDVYVVGERTFREGFAERCPGKWQELGGTWQYGEAENGKLKAKSAGPAKFIAGAGDWTDYRLSVDLDSRESGDIGLCSHYQDEGHFYLMRWLADADKLQLIRVVAGQESVLDEKQWTGPKKFPARFTVETTADMVTATVDGESLFASVSEKTLSQGKIGIWANGAASFDNVEVSFPTPAEPVLTLNEVFAGENSMADWSTSESDWIVRKQPVSDGEKNQESRYHYWHRSDFPGDCALEFSAEKESAPDGCTLTIAGEGMTDRTGYRLVLQKQPQPSVSLLRNGTLVTRQHVSGDLTLSHVRLIRRGQFILAYLDETRVLRYRDRNPLTGNRVGFSTPQKQFDTASLKVFSRNFYTYNFQKAPGEWRQAGGIWKVTNRWQCDPRWSFFSGESDRIAAIWNKRIFEGDLTLEFSAGIKMNAAKGQNYEYASDINATICADGNDLTSGYSILFGGKGNSGTQLVRKTEVVAESPERIPNQVLHRRWFAIKIQKRRDHLTLWIDNRKILEFTDPNPLSGQRLALWTYNNGLMVSRVRISSESGRTMELPNEIHPRIPRCIYD